MTVANGTASSRLFVGYYRVSTGKQSMSGLGLEAQRADVREFVRAQRGRLIAEYSETASGRRGNRPQLKAALSLCRMTRATLAVARLDRLSRNLELTTGLMETGLDFVAIDFPEANRFTIQILAAVAEYEAGIQSERMRESIAARKALNREGARPRKTWPRRFPQGCQQASALVRRARADARAADLAPLLVQAMAEGKSYAVIADEFNERGVRPPRQAPWTRVSIWRLVRFKPQENGVRRRPPTGTAQVRVAKLVDRAGPLLVARRNQGASYSTIADELEQLGIPSPQGRRWSPISIKRYWERALGIHKPRRNGSRSA